MKRLVLSILAAAAAIGMSACERHSWERTKVLHESHGTDHDHDHEQDHQEDAGHRHEGEHPKHTGEGAYGETAPSAE